MVAILRIIHDPPTGTESGEIKLYGRTLAIILKLIEFQDEINSVPQAKIQVNCSGKFVKVGLTKWSEAE